MPSYHCGAPCDKTAASVRPSIRLSVSMYQTTSGRRNRFWLNLLLVRCHIYNLFRRTLLPPCSVKWYLSANPHGTVHQKKAVPVQTSVKRHKWRKYGALVYNFNIFRKIYNTAFKMHLDGGFSLLCMPLIFTVWRFHFICFVKANSDNEVGGVSCDTWSHLSLVLLVISVVLCVDILWAELCFRHCGLTLPVTYE
jgi:hypothetical protein